MVRVTGEKRRLELIRAGMRVFSRHGFRGATTRKIAEEAGVNEAILYRYFSGKAELYGAILDEKRRETRAKVFPEGAARRRRDTEVFGTLARRIIGRVEDDDTFLRLVLFSALEQHRMSGRILSGFVEPVVKRLSDYIRGRAQEGTFRPMDPILAARAFLGMLLGHLLIQQILGQAQVRDVDAASEAFVAIALEGMRVRKGGRRG